MELVVLVAESESRRLCEFVDDWRPLLGSVDCLNVKSTGIGSPKQFEVGADRDGRPASTFMRGALRNSYLLFTMLFNSSIWRHRVRIT